MQWILAIFDTEFGDFIDTYVGSEQKILDIINKKCVINEKPFTDIYAIEDFLDADFDKGEFVFDPNIRFTVSDMSGVQYIVW